MNRLYRLSVLTVLACVASGAHSAPAAPPPPGRQVLSFDRDWRFHLGEVAGGEKPNLNDRGWRTLDVPHDFSIEGPPGADPSTMDGPFDRSSPGGTSSGALNGGIGWYRKAFRLPASARRDRVVVQFDGVYMDSDAWINGTHLGSHPYGFTSFIYDLTPYVRTGRGENVLAVRVNVQQPCSRWYSGAGIYRHVWLTLTQPVHVAQWGTYITTPQVTGTNADVRVRTRVHNDGAALVNASIVTVLLNPEGQEVARDRAAGAIAASADFEFDQLLRAPNIHRWSLEDPALYQAIVQVQVNGRPVDQLTTPFGIRTIKFTTDRGFFLNDQHVQIKGVCDHHDLGCLGAAVHRRGIERQLEILKSMGCNAIRTSHNPPAPELLELCDRMGFLVMDEAFDEWKRPKRKLGYSRFFDEWSEKDIVSMIQRDRNHPSIILWSIGNEIPEQGSPNGGEMAKRLADICHREDPTRPVTSACSNPGGAVKTGFEGALDVFGINYHPGNYKTYQGKLLVASETASAVSSRGEYGLAIGPDGNVQMNKRVSNQCSSYDLDRPNWGAVATDSLKALRNSPWVAGEFVWTGFDYLGEPTPFGWPSRSSYFGIVDLCGFPKDRYYLYQSRWSSKPMVHLLPHWNWEGFEGKDIPVWAWSSGDSVELFLNGKSLGEKSLKDMDNLRVEWSVPYAPGTLRAVAKKNGQVIATDEVHTAGKPARLVLLPDRKQIHADGEDLSYVQVRIEDKDGNLCPNAADKIIFTLEGAGIIAGLDNGDATSHEFFQGKQHNAFHGLALAVIQSTHTPGSIRLTARAEGLEPAEMTIEGV